MEFSTAGSITPEAMVWAEGMAEWLPASQIPGLFPNAVVHQPAPVAQTSPTFGSKPTAALGMRTSVGVDDPYPSPGIKAANFALWLGLFLGGITLFFVGMLMLGTAAKAVANQAIANQAAAAATTEATAAAAAPAEATAAEAAATEAGTGSEISSSDVGKMGIAGLILFAGALMNVLSAIPMYIYLYRAWSCLKPGGFARTTPGAAIGFLFIPFFNMYWIFQSFLGLAKDWNKTVATYSDLKSAPRMPEGVFLTFCIGCFVPPLAFIMIFPVMSRICNGINFFAFRPKPGQYSAFGAKPGGALAMH